MKIAVTSASGLLGSTIVTELQNFLDKSDIIAIARTPEKAESLGVQIFKGDYNEKEQFDKALQGVDVVLLVSGMDAPDKRVGQHRNVINAAKEAGVKKIVYTSIMGVDSGHAFSPIVASNRQTEKDIIASGLDYVIGRNGIYVEPDVEYIDNYIRDGKITNCAAEGKCSYTTRSELAFAYCKMLLEFKHNGNIYHLAGEAITQQQLTDYMNNAFGTKLVYESMSVKDYKANRTAELGDFLGNVISGIYESIRNGWSEVDSDFDKAAGRPHISWEDYFSKIGIK